MYTAVAHYIDWVTSTILRSGGMEACGYTIQASLQGGQGGQGGQSTTALPEGNNAFTKEAKLVKRNMLVLVIFLILPIQNMEFHRHSNILYKTLFSIMGSFPVFSNKLF